MFQSNESNNESISIDEVDEMVVMLVENRLVSSQ